MRTNSMTALVSGLVIGIALASTAFAASGNDGRAIPQSPVPVTPEPSVYLMAGLGIVLVVGYIVCRRNRTVQQVK